MANKPACIRLLSADDRKLALFIVGKANLECLAVANRQCYRHPAILSVWILLSLSFVQAMDWWPSNYIGRLGSLGYLRPLPAFASMALPLMFFIDWKNRPYFEKRTQAAIKEKDMHDPVAYYGESPASGFWIFEYGDTFVGLIALDASDAKRTHKGFIRHFYIVEAYRKTGIQEDLLRHALQHAFDNDSAVESVEGVDAVELAPYINNCYQQAGFRLGKDYQSAGVLGKWKYHKTILHRKRFSELVER